MAGEARDDVRRRAREEERRSLGLAMRTLRRAQGRTLADVAAAAGVSVSLLSQVERGLIDPSLDSLRDIAGALATTPFTLLANGSVRSRIVRNGTGVRLPLPRGDADYELLSPSLEGAFEVGRWTLQPGKSSADQPRGHPGEEATVILEGSVLLELGDEAVDLHAGDCVTYDARIPHRVTVLGDRPATAVFVISPPSF